MIDMIICQLSECLCSRLTTRHKETLL